MLDPLDRNCPGCGVPVRATDPRLCPYCGKLKNLLYDICPVCDVMDTPTNRRVRLPEPPPPPPGPTGTCPACEYRRPLNDKPCPWCDSHLLPLP